jgi:hypothetical protein
MISRDESGIIFGKELISVGQTGNITGGKGGSKYKDELLSILFGGRGVINNINDYTRLIISNVNIQIMTNCITPCFFYLLGHPQQTLF